MNSGTAPKPPSRRARAVAWIERRINLTELFSFLTHFGLLYTPVDTTRSFHEATEDITQRRLTADESGTPIFGVLTVLLFALEALTGLLLAFYYRPTPEAAFESTRMIVRDVPLGWFIHQIHAWGAYALIAVVSIRVVRLFWKGLYRAPREVLWWTAVCMAWFTVQFDLTGRLLTWDQQSYWTGVRALEVAYALPIYGRALAFVVGGHVVNQDVLLRFYLLHILALPALFTGAIYLSFATIRRVGLSPPRVATNAPPTTYRQHFYNLAMLTLLVFGALVTLAALVPFGFRTAADPYQTRLGAGPPWYFRAPYFLMAKAPGPALVWGSAWVLAALAILFLPLWSRAEPTPGRLRRERILGVIALVVWCLLGIAGSSI